MLFGRLASKFAPALVAGTILASSIVGVNTAASASPLTPEPSISQAGYSAILPTANGSGSVEADKELRSTVSKEIAGNQYQLEGGGNVNGSDILKPDGTVNNAVFEQLNNDSKGRLANDILEKTRQYTEPSDPHYNPSLAKSHGVDSSTANNWFKELQNTSGLGSKFIANLVGNAIHADLSGGAAWFKPFSGPLSSFLGFGAILIVSLMGIRSVVDLSYISLPPVRMALDGVGKKDGGGDGGSKLVSVAARNAVKEEESNGKNPIFYYFMKSAMQYIFLGIALFFLVFNYIWVIVGVIMDAGRALIS